MNTDKLAGAFGRLFIIIGPSGVGKTSLVQELVAGNNPCPIAWIPTFTSRPPRPGEKEGVNYFFVSEERFKGMIAGGELVEWSQAYRAFYGVGREKIREALNKAGTAITVMDRFGAIAVKKEMPTAQVILILPPSREILEQRLKSRNAETAEKIAFRLKQADDEARMEEENPVADKVIVNDLFNKTIEELREVVCFSK